MAIWIIIGIVWTVVAVGAGVLLGQVIKEADRRDEARHRKPRRFNPHRWE